MRSKSVGTYLCVYVSVYEHKTRILCNYANIFISIFRAEIDVRSDSVPETAADSRRRPNRLPHRRNHGTSIRRWCHRSLPLSMPFAWRSPMTADPLNDDAVALPIVREADYDPVRYRSHSHPFGDRRQLHPTPSHSESPSYESVRRMCHAVWNTVEIAKVFCHSEADVFFNQQAHTWL